MQTRPIGKRCTFTKACGAPSSSARHKRHGPRSSPTAIGDDDRVPSAGPWLNRRGRSASNGGYRQRRAQRRRPARAPGLTFLLDSSLREVSEFCIRFSRNSERLGLVSAFSSQQSGPDRDPLRPGESQAVRSTTRRPGHTETGVGFVGTQREPPDRPDSAEALVRFPAHPHHEVRRVDAVRRGPGPDRLRPDGASGFCGVNRICENPSSG